MTDAKFADTRAEILSIRLDNKEEVTRQEAIAAGITRYYTGKPCVHGHVAMRLTSNGRCIECHRQKYKDRRSGVSLKKTEAIEKLKKRAIIAHLATINKEPEHMRVYAAEAIARDLQASLMAIQEIIVTLEGK